MKKALIVFVVLMILLIQTVAISAITSSDAREEWKDAKKVSREAQEAHREAKAKQAGNQNPANEEEVIDTGKQSLHSALDEAEAWLIWKQIDAEENDEVPDELREQILEDVELNLEKIEDLRADVDGVTNRLELGLTFLKMIGKYFELLTDVSRNSGQVWVFMANERTDTIEEFELKLRETAEEIDDNEAIMERLDMASEERDIARRNIDNAEDTYKMVKLPGTPLLKFAEGNSYLRAARANMINAHSQLNQAYRMIVAGGN